MLLQAITIQDQVYEAALKSVDFIQRFISRQLHPSVSAITESVRRSTDMKVFHLEDIGPHYATTLRCWRENFVARLPEVRRLGYPTPSCACGSTISATARAVPRAPDRRRADAAHQAALPLPSVI